MTTIKSYTDIEQSRKLIKILPLESADMAYIASAIDDDGETLYTAEYKSEIIIHESDDYINCWSLAALLNVIDYPQLSKDKLGSGKTGWMVSVYPDNCRYDSCWHDNPVDSCVEMILKLHKLKML